MRKVLTFFRRFVSRFVLAIMTIALLLLCGIAIILLGPLAVVWWFAAPRPVDPPGYAADEPVRPIGGLLGALLDALKPQNDGRSPHSVV